MRARTGTSSGIIAGMLAARASAPRFTCTRICTGMGYFSIHLASGSRLPSSSRGFLAAGSSSSSSSSGSPGIMPGGRRPGAAVDGGAIMGGLMEVPGSLALMVETPVMGPPMAGSGSTPEGSAGVPPPGAGRGGAELFEELCVSWAVGGTMVCAGPASAPASRAAASAPASAASRICSSTEPNRSGLLATKLARLASTSSAKADSLRARSTSASFWCFHLGSSSKTFRWLDISSAGMSWPVMGQRCISRWLVAFLCRT
mmetsp:Transcript_80055/g.248433  ORF Transcript_80055/g.248433 Transcript_80055/m.248433 type:complete len:258 (-) Transcript_80055:157-930(-)